MCSTVVGGIDCALAQWQSRIISKSVSTHSKQCTHRYITKRVCVWFLEAWGCLFFYRWEACPTNYLMPTCIWAFWHLTMHQALPIVYDGFVFLKPRYDNKPTICIWVICAPGSNTFPTNQMYIAPKLTWTSIESYQKRSKLCVFLVFYPWICHFFLWPRLRRGTFWPTICIRTWFDETHWPKPTNQTYMAAVSVSLLSKSNLPIVYDSPSRHFVGGANFPTKIATWRERLLY